MTDYTKRAREFIRDIGLDADWADHEVTALAALLAAVADEQRERDANVCANLSVTQDGIRQQALAWHCEMAIRRQS